VDALPRWAVSFWRHRRGLTKDLSASKLNYGETAGNRTQLTTSLLSSR